MDGFISEPDVPTERWHLFCGAILGYSLGGMIDSAARHEIELVPTFSAYAYPSGYITEETYSVAEAAILEGIERAGGLDAVRGSGGVRLNPA